MTRPVGYYVHHQGAGHRRRGVLIARALRRPCTLIGTVGPNGIPDAPGQVIDLPDDRLAAGFDGIDGVAVRPSGLHYAPLGHAGIRDRMAAIAAYVARDDPALMIIDVSVEVALLSRLLSVPTLVWRLAGDRTDLPHLEAFRSAERLLAPFPPELDYPATPDWVREKTVYAGFIEADRPASQAVTEDGRIVVLTGRGGDGPAVAHLAAAARAVPDRAWHVLGSVSGEMDGTLPANLHLDGWVEDVAERLALASIVVGSGGDGVVAAVARAGKRFICLPEPRPYGEQTTKAHALARHGAAIVRSAWPEAGAWRGLLEEALALDPAILASFAPGGAVMRVTETIEEAIAGSARPDR